MFDHSQLVGLSNREKVLVLRRNGYQTKKISKVLGISYPLVWHWVQGGTLPEREFFERQRSGAIAKR